MKRWLWNFFMKEYEGTKLSLNVEEMFFKAHIYGFLILN